MSIPSRLTNYLDQQGAHYEVCPHTHSHSSAETARTARIQPAQLAKSVILEDDAGCVMAVVPSDKTVMLGEVARMLGRRELRLSDERRIADVFADCELGAVPPVGMAWDMETLVDDDLEAAGTIYLEAGDHECLLRMSHDEFHELMRSARHGHFSKMPTH